MTRGKPLLTKENPCHTLHCRKHCLESARDLLFDLRQQSRCGIWLTSLLHEPNSLSPGERELIATYVSSRNDCYFCQTSHGSAAAYHLGDANVVAQVKADFESAPVSAKLKALLAIAGKVQCDGKLVTAEDVERAKHEGATELEIHDTVLFDHPQPFACTSPMWTALVRGSRAMPTCTRRWVGTLPTTATRVRHDHKLSLCCAFTRDSSFSGKRLHTLHYRGALR